MNISYDMDDNEISDNMKKNISREEAFKLRDKEHLLIDDHMHSSASYDNATIDEISLWIAQGAQDN